MLKKKSKLRLMMYFGYLLTGASLLFSANNYYDAILTENYERISGTLYYLLPAVAGIILIIFVKLYSVILKLKENKE